MDFAQYFIYLFSFISLIYGVKSIKFLNPYFKYLLIQVLIYTCFFMGVYIMRSISKSGEFNNIFYVNMHVGVESILLFSAAFVFLKQRFERNVTLFLGIIFLSIFIFQILYFGPFKSNDLADVSSCIALTIVLSLVLKQSIRLNQGPWWKSPEIITTIGMLLYFAGSVPFVSMSNYLAKNATELYFLLFYIINDGLANVRYLFLAIAFFLIYRSSGKSQLQL